MRNKFLPGLLSISLFLFISSTPAAPLTNNDNAIFLNQTVTSWMQKNNVPGVAVEIYDHGVPHSYYFGYANRDQKTPITANTIFEVGSFTKLFTTLLLAQQINAGKMSLKSPLCKYVPDLTKANKKLTPITLENLATHTTGFPFKFPENLKDRKTLQQYLATWQPSTSLGTNWQYSNINIGLLGEALEAKLHQNYNQLYRGQILQPLGMEPIGLTVPEKYLTNYAQGYDKNANPVAKVGLGAFPAAGDIKMSANDSLLFLKAALGLPGIPQNIQAAMQLAQTPRVQVGDMQQALGWQVFSLADKNKLLNPPEKMNLNSVPAKWLPPAQQVFNANALIDKTGTTNGFNAYIGLIPGQQSGVVILANKHVANGAIVNLGRELLFHPNIK